MNKIFKDKIRRIIKGKVLFDEPMRVHTSFRIGGPAEVWIEPEDLGSLIDLLRFTSAREIPLIIIGGGSNILVKDEGVKGVVINLSAGYFKKIDRDDCGIKVSAGLGLRELLEDMREKELGGLEFMAAIPGTVGGAVMMNAGGRHKTISDLIDKIDLIDKKGKTFRLNREEINFSYRFSGLDDYIILRIYFRLQRKPQDLIDNNINRYNYAKRTYQELGLPSAGSVFKNPQGTYFPSAKLIELSGLKGKTLGGAQVSTKHANFIVNLGGATAEDVLELIKLVKTRVKRDHGVDLELEIKVI
jgi:UDP-N-acetylmuramate dehydrogenase